MVVNGPMLASELRRRRVGPRSLADSVQGVARSTWLLGDLRSTPTDLLVLAALNLAPDPAVDRRAAWPERSDRPAWPERRDRAVPPDLLP